MRKTVLIALAILMAFGSMSAAAQQPKKGKWVIALSNSYYGNMWRKQSVEAFEEAAKAAKAQGWIKDYVIVNGDGTQNTQISQMNSLILKKVDAICINAASPTALNGVIDQAAKAGVKVLAFDSIVSTPSAWTMDFNFVEQGEGGAQFVADKLGGKGNVLIVRGVTGSAPDQDMYKGQMNVLAKYPNLKVVGTVYGEATTTVTQAAVANILPSLPQVDAVLTQGGGDAYGAVQAFEAANRPMPIIIGDNSAEFIQWWMKKMNDGYSTYSICSAPGIGGAAFWTSLAILNKVDVPKKMSLKVIPITNANAKDFSTLKPGTLASPTFTWDYVMEKIIKAK